MGNGGAGRKPINRTIPTLAVAVGQLLLVLIIVCCEKDRTRLLKQNKTRTNCNGGEWRKEPSYLCSGS